MSERYDRDDIRARLAALRAEGARRIAELAELRERMDAQAALLNEAIARNRAALWRLWGGERGDEGEEASGALGVRQPLTPRGPAPRHTARALKEPL